MMLMMVESCDKHPFRLKLSGSDPNGVDLTKFKVKEHRCHPFSADRRHL
jgi:hypothetical protein